MKYLVSLALVLAVAGTTLTKRSDPLGIDVSDYQPNINWNNVVRNGIKFVSIKATEGTTYRSPTFNSQYIGATNVGLIRGSYHFAHPDSSTGAAQAEFFLKHGDNPSGPECYGLSHSAMVSWIKDFSNTYKDKTGRYPMIYTTTDWWRSCTGNSAAFGNDNPLWIAHYASEIGTLPAGWQFTSFWQYADSGPNPGDADLWNGSYDNLKKFARGG